MLQQISPTGKAFFFSIFVAYSMMQGYILRYDSVFIIVRQHNIISQMENLISQCYYRAPDKQRIFISTMLISSPNPMFDHLLESSHRDDSNKWSNVGIGEEIRQVESTESNFTRLIWSSVR